MPISDRFAAVGWLTGAAAALLAVAGCRTGGVAAPAAQPRENSAGTAARAATDASSAAGFASLNAVVTSLVFFESGEKAPPKEERAYRTRFVGEETRYVNWELSLRYRPPPQKIDFTLDAEWIDPTGKVFRRQRFDAFVRAGTTSSWHSLGFGNPTAGAAWREGDYRVVLRADGKEFASGSFRIVAARSSAGSPR